MKQNNFPLTLKSTALVIAMSVLLTGCGGDDDENNAPTATNAVLALDAGQTKTLQITASDADGDTLTYSIQTAPTKGSATIDSSTGLLSYTAEAEGSTLTVRVSDGTDTADATITISINTVANFSFKDQFYKVTNPQTTNSQIVHYNSETDKQTVIKTDVILGNNVFVMSGTKEADGSTKYTSREYGIFHDPSASSETRTYPDGQGGVFEQVFHTNHKLKSFAANVNATEKVIFEGNKDFLGDDLDTAGIKVIDSSTNLMLNVTDIENSYVELNAYDKLADSLEFEKPEDMLHLPITVRLSDSKMVQGRPLAIIKDNDGKTTTSVLVNFIAPHKAGAYPTGTSDKKRLQSCNASLTTCTDIASAEGDFYHFTENSTHVYLTKDNSKKIFAFNKSNSSLVEVTGVEYPTEFDHHHHLIKLRSTGGHGIGLFDNFFNLLDSNEKLSEGNVAYAAVNYDLDINDPTGPNQYGAYGFVAHVHKHAMILKLTGTTGIKVYENGDGVDHKNDTVELDTTPISYHVNLIAVNGGSLLIEASQFNGGLTCVSDKNCNTYAQAWLNTDGQAATKTDFDNKVIANDLPYLTGFRVPPKAVGDDAYFTKRDGQPVAFGGTGVVYNIYQYPLTDTSLAFDGTGVTHVLGRMLFERTAFRDTGIYDGTVILWNKANGDIIDATNDKIIGNDNLVDPDDEGVSYVTGRTGSDNLAGVGGIFGLKMSMGHPSRATFLTSGESNKEGSLKKVNRIKGTWITD